MSYKDIDGVSYWISEREQDLPQNVDPYKKAAELFAVDVEVYLYREVNPDGSASPLYQNPDFLAWAIARYDACKSGSGGDWHNYSYSEQSADSLTPVPPRNYDGRIRPVNPPTGGKD